MAKQEKKRSRNAQANHFFQSISGSNAMLWNFQFLKCLDKHKMMEEKAGVERQNSKRGFERMRMPAACWNFPWFRIFLPVRIQDSNLSGRQYLKVACPTRKIQSSSKLRQVRKWKAEIPDTPPGLSPAHWHRYKHHVTKSPGQFSSLALWLCRSRLLIFFLSIDVLAVLEFDECPVPLWLWGNGFPPLPQSQFLSFATGLGHVFKFAEGVAGVTDFYFPRRQPLQSYRQI